MPCLKISDESFWHSEGSPLGWLWLLRQSGDHGRKGGARVDMAPPQTRSFSGVSLIIGTSGGSGQM